MRLFLVRLEAVIGFSHDLAKPEARRAGDDQKSAARVGQVRRAVDRLRQRQHRLPLAHGVLRREAQKFHAESVSAQPQAAHLLRQFVQRFRLGYQAQPGVNVGRAPDVADRLANCYPLRVGRPAGQAAAFRRRQFVAGQARAKGQVAH